MKEDGLQSTTTHSSMNRQIVHTQNQWTLELKPVIDRTDQGVAEHHVPQLLNMPSSHPHTEHFQGYLIKVRQKQVSTKFLN